MDIDMQKLGPMNAEAWETLIRGLITFREGAVMLGLDESSIYNAARKGTLDVFLLRGRKFFFRDQVREYREARP